MTCSFSAGTHRLVHQQLQRFPRPGRVPGRRSCGNWCSALEPLGYCSATVRKRLVLTDDESERPGHHRLLHSNDASGVQYWREARPSIKSPIAMQTPPVFLDRPPTPASNLVSYSSTLRGCQTKFSHVDSGGIFSSTALLLILSAASKARFTNSICFLLHSLYLPMQVVQEHPPFFPSAVPSAVHVLLIPQGCADTFPSPLSEVYSPTHGVYTMFGTHLQGL